MPWDPDRYLMFADERALPFRHLVSAVEHLRPQRVLDIGCGPGALTATLLERWPDATILGLDSSEEMIELARRRAIPERLAFELADVLSWSPRRPFDLVISNACLHWIADHSPLLDRLAALMTGTATLAIQVPANHDRPSHTILAELCSSARWRHLLDGLPLVTVRDPAWYAEELAARGFGATVWQTTYHHRLTGENPVLEWVRGAPLRPMLDRLGDAGVEAFTAEYGARLRTAYPECNGVTTFPFTRTFMVATRS